MTSAFFSPLRTTSLIKFYPMRTSFKSDPLTKMVGVARTTGTSETTSTSAASEFSVTVGIGQTAGPADVAQVTHSMEMSMGVENTWSQESST